MYQGCTEDFTFSLTQPFIYNDYQGMQMHRR